jgi:hypothetical protein
MQVNPRRTSDWARGKEEEYVRCAISEALDTSDSARGKEEEYVCFAISEALDPASEMREYIPSQAWREAMSSLGGLVVLPTPTPTNFQKPNMKKKVPESSADSRAGLQTMKPLVGGTTRRTHRANSCPRHLHHKCWMAGYQHVETSSVPYDEEGGSGVRCVFLQMHASERACVRAHGLFCGRSRRGTDRAHGHCQLQSAYTGHCGEKQDVIRSMRD